MGDNDFLRLHVVDMIVVIIFIKAYKHPVRTHWTELTPFDFVSDERVSQTAKTPDVINRRLLIVPGLKRSLVLTEGHRNNSVCKKEGILTCLYPESERDAGFQHWRSGFSTYGTVPTFRHAVLLRSVCSREMQSDVSQALMSGD